MVINTFTPEPTRSSLEPVTPSPEPTLNAREKGQIPGLAPRNVTVTLEHNRFTCTLPVKGNRYYERTCTRGVPGVQVFRVVIYGQAPGAVDFIEASIMQYENPDEETAIEILNLIASQPYDGAEPDQASAWLGSTVPALNGGAQETAFYAAGLETFLAASARNHVWGGVTAPFRGSANDLFPGVVLPALVLLGGLHLWRARRRPGRDAIALAAMLAAAVLVALGPEVRLFGRPLFPGPFALAREIPLVQMIRVPSRAGAFIALPLAVLAARAFDRLAPRALAGAMVAVLAGVALAAGFLPGLRASRVSPSAALRAE